MSRSTKVLVTCTTALALAACADFMNSGADTTLELSPVFQSVPAGFSANSSSFDSAADLGMPFFPSEMRGDAFGSGGNSGPGPDGGKRHGDRRGTGDHRDGFGGPGVRGILMGGGLGKDFLGFHRFGRGRGRGPFSAFHLPDSCTYDSTSTRVTCPDKVKEWITITASYQFKDTAGVPQPKYDTATTDFANAQVTVNGTKVRPDSATSTIDHRSDATITGLAAGSTERTVNGTASAVESTTGVRDSIEFSLVRTASDTVTGLVIPLMEDRPTIPNAGVVIRNMRISITKAGETRTKSRREQITFDGTNVVSVIITQDGVTKNCTITLPSRKLVCE
jgi:hypothetical protein